MTNVVDEFENPTESFKKSFGVLTVYVNRIQFAKGASYSIPGISGNDGKPFQFKGKQLSDAGNQTHVVLVLTKTTKEGTPYQVVKDCLTSDRGNGEPFQKIVRPSLVKAFGEHYGTVVGKQVPVLVEEVPYGEEYDATDQKTGASVKRQKKMFRIAQAFASYDEMKAAEHAYFAQFGTANGEIDTNALPPAEVMEMLASLYKTNTPDVFKNLITGAPEVEGYSIDAIVKQLEMEKGSF